MRARPITMNETPLHALEPKRIKPKIEPKKIAIIAGNGVLPRLLIDALIAQNMTPFVVGFDGQTPPALKSHTPALWTRLGRTGFIFKTLRRAGITDIIMIGGMRRPKLWQLIPDWETLKFFITLGLDRGGDDSFLKRLVSYLNKKGFQVRGAHEFLNDTLAPMGQIGAHAPAPHYTDTIKIGVRESQNLGAADLGQSVVVQGARVIAREDKSGTDALIRRAALLSDPNLPPPILVKTCKPQQDRRFDLPTIGVDTAQICADNGYGGIVVQAGATFLIHRDKVAQIADMYSMFVVGQKIP